MTRFARGYKKKHVDASSWEELRSSATSSKDQDDFSNSGKKVDRKTEKKPGKALSKQELKQDKQREARRKRRKMKKICFHCRKPGHALSKCPSLETKESPVDICFKCGSTEHKVQKCRVKVSQDEYPFAKCFVCGKEGHLSKQCPDNPRGLYPFGGGCKMCGSVEHFKKDCPEARKTVKTVAVSKITTYDNTSADAEAFSDGEDKASFRSPSRKKTPKIVKF